MELLDRVKQLCKERSISVSVLEDKLDFPRNTIYQWKSRTPGTDKLEKVADYFNVSIDFLLGREQVPEWASEEDILELDKMLDSNVNMSYGGENLTEEEKQRVKDVLTGVFWEKLEKKKKHKN